jgi:succinate-semialdehyde dehydrogenase/glutarate-semialdehyde dehydrogenase
MDDKFGTHIIQIASKYRNAGQTCGCADRIPVQDGVYDAFTKRLAETAGAMKVADGFEPGAVIGPLIDMKAVEKVEAHIADAVKKGAKVVTGGKRAAQGGSFFEPTVLTDVTTDMVITKEETFGPVPRSTASRPTPRPSGWPATPPP